MAFFRKIVAGLVKSDINAFVGEQGNIFFDVQSGEFRLSDGTTPGGIPLGTGGGGGYTLPTASTTVKGGVKIDGTTIQINGAGVIRGFSGNYNDLSNKPIIPAAQIQSDWAQTNSGSLDFIKNKPTPYSLPIATSTILGGIKVGAGLSINPTTGVLSASGAVAQLTVSEINTANVITNEVSNVSKIRFDKDTGFSVQDLGSGEIKVSLGSSFKTWKVNGQTDLVAVGEDTVEFIAGDGITLTTNPTAPNKSMTITGNMFWSSKSW
jgi:hypothetical protein